MEAVETLVALMLFITGLWLLSPFYNVENSAVGGVTASRMITLAFGLLQVFMIVPMLYALARFGWPKRQRVRRLITFTSFVLLLFYGFSGILLYGLSRVTWISTFTLALIMGVAHIKLKLEAPTNA